MANHINLRGGGPYTAGILLVFLPLLALTAGMSYIDAHPMVGLPVLAILGIMILFSSMVLTTTLFQHLKLLNDFFIILLYTSCLVFVF